MNDLFNGQSFKRTPYAVNCLTHGKVYLTGGEYNRQLMKADDRWSCPVMDTGYKLEEFGLCGRISEFDDDNFEEVQA